MHFDVDNMFGSSLVPINRLYSNIGRFRVGVAVTKDVLPELAGSSTPIAQSENQVARQRMLISRLHAQGKPTAPAEQVLAQIESNLRLMHKVHQFIRVGKA